MSGQSRQKIPKLGQLHLNLPFTGVRTSGENIQNELGAIDDFRSVTSEMARACAGREILVEDHEVGSFLKRAHHNLFAVCPSRANTAHIPRGCVVQFGPSTRTPADSASSFNSSKCSSCSA